MDPREKQEFEIIIDETFKELDKISRNMSNSRLIFPKYQNQKGNLRISEQELRFLFIEHLKPFLEEHNYYYSIETPTKDHYKFSEKKQQITPRREKSKKTDNEKFESASFDLVIHRNDIDDNKERVALIEFKSKGNMHEYAKDICKLGNTEEGGDTTSRYFIIVVNNTGKDKRGKTTEQSIQEKFSNKNKQIDFKSFKNDKTINIICYSLELGEGKKKGKYIDPLSDTKLENWSTPEIFKQR